MTLDEIRRNLALMKRAREQRTEVYRVLVSPDGKEIRRVYRGSFDKHRAQNNGHVQRKTNHAI